MGDRGRVVEWLGFPGGVWKIVGSNSLRSLVLLPFPLSKAYGLARPGEHLDEGPATAAAQRHERAQAEGSAADNAATYGWK